MFGIAGQFSERCDLQQKCSNRCQTLSDFTPRHRAKIFTGGGKNLDRRGKNDDTRSSQNSLSIELCIVQENFDFGQENPHADKPLRHIIPIHLSEALYCGREYFDCSSKQDHTCRRFGSILVELGCIKE